MATVYLGHDAFHHRDVAIKVANPYLLKDEDLGSKYREMFFNEAKVAGMLKHPNLVSIYDAGVEGDICYIVMEYIRGGRTLKTHCTPDSLLPIEDTVHIISKCAKALDHAHRKGVIHRDIKPANILLTEDGEVKVVDFGIALVTKFDATQIQGRLGSPLYMSPEQLRQEDVTSQTDIFSLGVVLYQLLAGRHPFAADNLAAITHGIAEGPHTPVREFRAEIPDMLEHIVERTLKKAPQKRYKSGIGLARELGRVLGDLVLDDEELSDQEKFKMVEDLTFFNDFPEPEVWEVVNASKWQEFQPGDTIIKEGELDNSFYVIASGDVLVRKGSKNISTLSQGECFGEMGFITRQTRTANVVAKIDVRVMKVSASLIERTSHNCQLRFQKVFLNTLAGRLKVMTEQASQTTP